jgi:ATP-dependent RNA helicase RhlE
LAHTQARTQAHAHNSSARPSSRKPYSKAAKRIDARDATDKEKGRKSGASAQRRFSHESTAKQRNSQSQSQSKFQQQSHKQNLQQKHSSQQKHSPQQKQKQPMAPALAVTTPNTHSMAESFRWLGLSDLLLRAIADCGYKAPSPVQEQSIPAALRGEDLLVCAQTGTGKTAAFALPILEKMGAAENDSPKSFRLPVALVLTPTRELAAQITQDFQNLKKYVGRKVTSIYGGVSQVKQVRDLHDGTDILVATPGRLNDLIGQGRCDLSAIETLVLDESDRMLDMGFAPDVKQIMEHFAQKPQTMLFSATMDKKVKALAETILSDPYEIAISLVDSAVDLIDQSVYFVSRESKFPLLEDILRGSHGVKQVEGAVLVFSRTKYGADRIAKGLNADGIVAKAMHGNKSQNARARALRELKSGEIRVLVATDVASRGIDIDHLPLVVNYDIPEESAVYVHRIGRTGRAGATGQSIAFCDRSEYGYLRDIEKLMDKKIPVVTDHPYDISARVLGNNNGKEENADGSRRYKRHRPKNRKEIGKAKRAAAQRG